MTEPEQKTETTVVREASVIIRTPAQSFTLSEEEARIVYSQLRKWYGRGK